MAKGSDFERFIAKDLSLWWTDGERDDIFWRTSGSGARATTRRKCGLKTADSYGDICTIDPIGKPLTDLILFELKKGYSQEIQILSFLDLPEKRGAIKLKKPVLLRWWEKAEEERNFAGREYSIIIFRRDDKNIMVMCNEHFMFHLRIIGKSLERPPMIRYDESIAAGGLCLFRYDDFKSYLCKENIIEELNRVDGVTKLIKRLKTNPKLTRVQPRK